MEPVSARERSGLGVSFRCDELKARRLRAVESPAWITVLAGLEGAANPSVSSPRSTLRGDESADDAVRASEDSQEPSDADADRLTRPTGP